MLQVTCSECLGLPRRCVGACRQHRALRRTVWPPHHRPLCLMTRALTCTACTPHTTAAQVTDADLAAAYGAGGSGLEVVVCAAAVPMLDVVDPRIIAEQLTALVCAERGKSCTGTNMHTYAPTHVRA